MLYEDVVEVKERLVLMQEKCEMSDPHHGVVTGKSDVEVSHRLWLLWTDCSELLIQLY